MGFFKAEAMRLAKESVSFLDDLGGQETSLKDQKVEYPSLVSNWEEWEYDVENEEVTAMGAFGFDGCEYDKMLIIRVRPIDNERFVIYGTKIEEN